MNLAKAHPTRVALAAALVTLVAAAAAILAVRVDGTNASHVLGDRFTASGGGTGSGSGGGSVPKAPNNGHGGGNGGPGVGSGPPTPPPGHVFYLSGAATDLAPGATVPLHITVRNPNNQALQITQITVAAEATTIPGCDSTWVTSDGYQFHAGDQPVTVPANANAVVDVPLTMADKDFSQNSCIGADFPLTITALGRQA